MRGIDVKGGEVEGLERLGIRGFGVFAIENRSSEKVIFFALWEHIDTWLNPSDRAI